MHANAVSAHFLTPPYLAGMKSSPLRRVSSAALALFLLACNGTISEPGLEPGIVPGPAPRLSPSDPVVPQTALRRLTRDELEATLELALELTDAEVSGLPGDPLQPFDNDYTGQLPSTALVAGIDEMARGLSVVALPDMSRLERLASCEGADCPAQLATHIGRRLLRRPLAAEEVDAFAALGATEDVPLEGARLVLRVLLSDLELHYRVEGSEAGSDGRVELNDAELATRLSFLLWGSGPDDQLLDLVESGGLRDALASEASRMLDDERAERQTQRFHAMWIGYRDIDARADLVELFRDETEALIQRIVFEDGSPWLDFLTYPETYLTPALAEHYGVDGVTSPGFYPPGEGRAGLLAHGSFLANGRIRGDSSPTRRGKFVRERLMCRDIIVPDDLPVDVDEAPASNGCKPQRYEEHAGNGACSGCHSLMDPIGFGLEHYDLEGRYRTMEEPGMDGEGVPFPECEIEGQGAVVPLGDFTGPAALGALLRESEDVQHCAVTQYWRFATGRRERAEDEPAIQELVDGFGQNGTFLDLIRAYVQSDSFLYRQVDP
ncbi:MAG: hypothetical protein ACI9KE_006425 [Polyangiales bacterium]|jgi:hypothetical protein